MTQVVILDAELYERLSTSCPTDCYRWQGYGTNLHDFVETRGARNNNETGREVVTEGKTDTECAILCLSEPCSNQRQIFTFRGDVR
jgi:hypothetical protein